MSILLQAQDLTLDQGGRCLVDKLDLQIRAGECWMLIGPNGSGKTTLMKTFAGLVSPESGTILLQETPLDQMSARRRALAIGLVFQHGNAGLHNTVTELAMSGHHPRRQHWWDTPGELKCARQALQEVGLSAHTEQNAQSLSGGELRRAEIARLLVQDPALALLDEPFNHLDIGQQVAIVRILKRHFTRPGRALFMVAHDLNLVVQVASHCLLLHGDGNWSAGPVEQVANRNTLSKVFQHPLREYRGPDGLLWGPNWELHSHR